MKPAIHPDYKPAKVVCACGNVIETRSTRGDFHIEICSNCHPFFTGKQKLMDTAGRIERFKTRYAAGTATPAPQKPAPAPAPAKKVESAKENRAAKRAKANAGKPRPPEPKPAEPKPAEPAEPAAEPKAE